MLSRYRHQDQRGFTLTEILVTTAIFAIIMIAALAVYDRSNQVFKSSTEAADMQQSTRIGFDKLVSDIRMAGFDYSRGGIPQNAWEAPQPDEQIEYAGETAVVFRANFNYNSAAAQQNGLEPAFTPHNVDGKAIFPYVTTSNQEIIAYVLRSANAAANTGSISFFTDDYEPRSVFPSTITPAPAGTNPPHPEAQVVINGIDTTNANPPYTLYRVTLADGNCNGPCTVSAASGTPVAENLRSLNLKYYTDLAGTTLVTNQDGTAITATRNADGSTIATSNSGAIGGAGQYNADNIGTTANFSDRQQRALIGSVRVNLVGMNASPDLQGYTNPTETIASIKGYRQYALSSLVVPRNLGLTGFPEPSYTTAAPPTIVGMCTGHCGAPVIYWEPPTSGTAQSYRIEWDTNQNGAFNNYVLINDPSLTQAILPDDGSSDVSLTYYYRMESINENGQSPASGTWSAIPNNRTKPMAPANLGSTAAQANRIPLQWNAPANNATPLNVLACSGSGGSTDGSVIPSQEIVHFRVKRGTQANFDPTSSSESVRILDYTSPSQPPAVTGGSLVNWNDSGITSAFYPANCTPYYYRVEALDRCYKQNNWNFSNNQQDSISGYSAAAGPFQSTATNPPTVPVAITVDRTSTDGSGNLWTGCPDPSNVASTNCRIKLDWQPVLTDTASPANVIGIDQYVVTRRFRFQQTGGPYLDDTNFGTGGSLTINCFTGTCSSGFSQQSPNSTRSFVDTPPFVDPNSGLVLEYQYTLAAKNCSLYSGNPPNGIQEAAGNSSALTNDPPGPNPYVSYPGCSTNPAIVQAGAQNPSASGDSPSQAWIFNDGDTVTVTPGSGTTVQSVEFQLFTWPTPTQVGGDIITPAPGPYLFTWTNQPGADFYSLRITINTFDSQGNPCQEVHIKYIQQQTPAPCFFPNTIPPAPSPAGHGSNPETDTVTLTVTNTGGEPIKFERCQTTPCIATGLGFSGGGQISITYASPDLPNHQDLQLTDIAYNMPAQASQSGSWGTSPNITAQSFTTTLCAYGSCPTVGTGTRTTTVSFPSTLPDLLPGNSMTIRLSFKFDSRSGKPSLPSTPSADVKTCLTYRILSEPTVNKNCNLVGQSATTANPTSCD